MILIVLNGEPFNLEHFTYANETAYRVGDTEVPHVLVHFKGTSSALTIPYCTKVEFATAIKETIRDVYDHGIGTWETSLYKARAEVMR